MLHLVIVDFFALVTCSVSLHSADAVFHNNSRGETRHGSCRLRSVREIGDEGFGGAMTQSFVLDDVEYKLCRYRVTWDEALIFCSTHEAHLATLDDEEKTLFVAQAIASSSSVAEDYWIGGRKYFGDVWTWDSNAKRLDEKTNMVNNIPLIFYPEAEINDEILCLTIDRAGHETPIFVPRSCNQQRGFICQRDNDRNFNAKIRMMAASRIGEDEYRLYSGRATWAEAVVQCRQEGLQIAQVDTAEKARALAISMLRSRPIGIESAWIGGYRRKKEPSTWRWLASGEKIKRNEMWQKNLTELSDGCLLLDRHMCEIPIYVNSKCDRRRDVLCQKSPKKRLRKKPVEAIVDGCPYWIGFYPSKWSDASRSCDSLNASLVALDSPEIISHMMKLMLDNGADLRHIWTDGRRTRKNGQWRWQVNDEVVPIYGESFIPWCPQDDDYSDESNCLNLDRENLDSAVVYGLSCEEKQPYVCQPRTGECVLHPVLPSAKKSNEKNHDKLIEAKFNTISLKENSQSFERSGVTGTMPLINDNEGPASSSTFSSAPYFMDVKNDWKIDQVLSSGNATSGRNLSNYLNPLSRLTLPSFPQFGIKVASAHETTSTSSSINYEHRKMNKMNKYLANLTTVAKSPYSESTTSQKSLINVSSNNTRKIENGEKKINQGSISSRNDDRSESTTKTIKSTAGKTSKSKKIDDLSTTESSFSLPISKIDGKTTEEVRKKHFETTTRKNPDNFVENGEKIVSTGTKKIGDKSAASNTLRKISSLPKRTTNFISTTQFPPPYDAIDEDYYDNYEAEVTSQYNYETNARLNDEEDENSDESAETSGKTLENSSARAEKKSSSPTLLRKKISKGGKNSNKNDDEKLSIPVINELSKNLQNALINMLKNGVDKKSSNGEIAKTTTRSLGEKNIGFSREDMTEISMRMKNNSDLLTIRPYYAFEGPMIVALTDYSKDGENPMKIDGNGRGRDFLLIVKDEKNLTPKNDKKETRGFGKNPSSHTEANKGINNNNNNNLLVTGMSKVMDDLPVIKPDDPNSLMEMGRFFKDKFGDIVEINRNSDRIHPDGFRVNAKNSRNRKINFPKRRHRMRNEQRNNYEEIDDYDKKNENQYDNNDNINVDAKTDLNRPEIGRRLYPRGNNGIRFPPSQREQTTSDEKSWQERLSVSWPDEENATSFNIVRLDESGPENGFLPSLRTARSSGEDSTILDIGGKKIASFPDFRITNLIKEFKVDMDQRSLRKYLENLTIKLANDAIDYRKDDWKDTWRYIFIEMSKIFDRMNVNVNGEIMKIRIVGDEKMNSDAIDNTRKNELMRKLRKRKKDFTNFLRNMSKNAVPKASDNKSYGSNDTEFIDNRQVSSDILDKEISEETTTMKSMVEKVHDDYFNESSIEKNSADRNNEKSMIFATPQTGSASGDVEKPSTKLKKKFFPRYPTFSRPWTSDKINLGRDNDDEKLPNVYRTKYENFNDSHILAAPAIIGSVGEPKIYNFQPIMQQLHHRLAFNQGLGEFRPDRKIDNITEKPRIFRGENLPRGILSRITSGEYRIYPDETTPKPIVLSKENYDSEDSYETLKNDNNEWKKIDGDKNQRKNDDFIDDKNDDEFEPEDANEKIASFDDHYSAEKISSPTIRLRKAIELPRNLRTIDENRRVFQPRKNRVAKRTTNDENLNKILKNLQLLTEEPSIVSLKITINPDDDNKAITRTEESKNLRKSRTIEIRLKFTGSQKKIDEKNHSPTLDGREKTFHEPRAVNGTRKASRVDEKIRKREMLQKLRDMSRKISTRNDTLSWKKKNGYTLVDLHDRKSRNTEFDKNIKNSSDDKSINDHSEEKNSTNLRNFGDEKIPLDRNDEIASLFTNISEEDNQLTLFINLTLSEFLTKLEQSQQPET